MSDDDFEVQQSGVGGAPYPEETRDPDHLLDCIRRLRTAAAAERRASKSRALLVETTFLEDGTIQVAVCDPEGDRSFELAVGRAVTVAVTQVIGEATKEAQHHREVREAAARLQDDYDSLEWSAAKIVEVYARVDHEAVPPELRDMISALRAGGRDGWVERALEVPSLVEKRYRRGRKGGA